MLISFSFWKDCCFSTLEYDLRFTLLFLIKSLFNIFFPLRARMSPYTCYNSSMDWTLQSPFKCSERGNILFMLFFLLHQNCYLLWLLVFMGLTLSLLKINLYLGAPHRRLLLDTLSSWSNCNCFSSKWQWNLLAFPFCGECLIELSSVID